MNIVLATRNKGKVREIKEILKGLRVRILTLTDFPKVPQIEENGATLRQNAIHKAVTVADLTGITALADDSGLEVDALGGRPGVNSARFAGKRVSYKKNNEKLLRELRGKGAEKRKAKFRCVAALVSPGGRPRICEGSCRGIIAQELSGKNGFGYDPLFFIPRLKKTFAQIPLSLKNEISHRARAFRKMREILNNN